MFGLTLTTAPPAPLGKITHFLVDPALLPHYAQFMAYRPVRVRTSLALLTAFFWISSVGCQAPGSNSALPGGGERSGLSSSPGISWDSRSTLRVGALEIRFHLATGSRARILPSTAVGIPTTVPRPTEP